MTLNAKSTIYSSTAVDVIIGDVRQALKEYNAAAAQALTHSTEAWQKTIERNFTQYSRNITEHTRMAENISAHIEETLTRVNNFKTVNNYVLVHTTYRIETGKFMLYLKHERTYLNTFLNTNNRVENTTCSGEFLTNFQVFENVVKQCLKCLISYLILSYLIETKTKENRTNKIYAN